MSDQTTREDRETEQSLRDEIKRLNKIINALMNRAERSTCVHGSDFSLFQTAILLEGEVHRRTGELEAALFEHEKVTRELRESEAKFHRLVEQSMVGIVLSECDRFVYVNPKLAEMTGYGMDELLRMKPLDIIHVNDRMQAADLIRRGFANEVGQIHFTSEVACKDGKTVIVEVAGGLPVPIGGKPAMISVWADITERVRAENEIKMLNARLREQSLHDPLTGLFNRRYLEETLERELIRARRLGQPVSVVMGDLDHFKVVNDTYGHLAGDEVLRSFGDLLKRHSRGCDIYCRYGGEEFLLVMSDMPLEHAVERAELLRRTIADLPIPFDGTAIRVNASFGVAAFPQHGETAELLIAAADKALYRAKEAGRNRVQRAGDLPAWPAAWVRPC